LKELPSCGRKKTDPASPKNHKLPFAAVNLNGPSKLIPLDVTDAPAALRCDPSAKMTSMPLRILFDSIIRAPGGRLSSSVGRLGRVLSVEVSVIELREVGTMALVGESFGGSTSKSRPDLLIRIIPIEDIRSSSAIARGSFFIWILAERQRARNPISEGERRSRGGGWN
jgi:hypothetical protein